MVGRRGFMQLVTHVPSLILIAVSLTVLIILLWIARPSLVSDVEAAAPDRQARTNLLLLSFLESETRGIPVSDLIVEYALNTKDTGARARLEMEAETLFSFAGKEECYSLELKYRESVFFQSKSRTCESPQLAQRLASGVSWQPVAVKEALVPLYYRQGSVTARLTLSVLQGSAGRGS